MKLEAIKASSANRTRYLVLGCPSVGFIKPSIKTGRLLLNLSYLSEYLYTKSWSLFMLLSAIYAARGHFILFHLLDSLVKRLGGFVSDS